MLTTFRQQRGVFVFSKGVEKGVPIGQFVDFIIDPDTGKCVALWIRAPGGLRIILSEDVSGWRQKKITIQDEHCLGSPEGFPVLEKTFDKEVPIIGAPVFSHRKKIGKVVDFSFDTISPRILSLEVQNGWWIFGEKRIIPAKSILKINQKGIFIDSPTGKIKKIKEEKNSSLTKNPVPKPEVDKR